MASLDINLDDKKCGPRKSKLNPNVYTVDELRKIANNKKSELNLTTTEIRKKTKDELCKILFGSKEDVDFSDLDLDKNEEDLGEKKCGPRKSKLNPNVYTVDELRKIANDRKAELGLTTTEIRKKTKDELCNILFNVELPAKKEKKQSEEQEEQGEKKCGPRKSKLNPYVYTVDELRKIANDKKSELNLTTAEIRKKTKDELCKILFGDKNDKKKVDELDLEEEQEEQKDEKEFDFSVFDLSSDEKQEDEIDLSELDIQEPEEVSEEEKQVSSCSKPINKSITLNDYQIFPAEFLIKNRGLLFIASTGSGKTLAAVAAMNCILKNYPTMKILFIAPKSLLQNFLDNITKFGLDYNDLVRSGKLQLFSKEKFYKLVEKEGTGICKNAFLIIDEVQYFKTDVKLTGKNQSGFATAQMIKCAQQASKILLMSATPVSNTPYEIVNYITMIDGLAVNQRKTKSQFKAILNNERDFVDYFSCKLKFVSFKYDEKYPERIDVTHDINMDPKFYNEYFIVQEQKEKEALSFLYGSMQNLKMFYSALRQATLGLGKDQNPKLIWLMKEINKNLTNNEKLIIYSAFTKEEQEKQLGSGMFYLKNMLKEKNINYREVTGDIEGPERTKAVNDFNEGKTNILILSKAGGTGLDLKEVRHVYLMEGNWNAADDEQIIGRAIRINSHKNLPKNQQNVTVHRIIFRKPVIRNKDDKIKETIDEILNIMSIRKDTEIEEFMNRLKRISINNSSDCKQPEYNNIYPEDKTETIKKDKKPNKEEKKKVEKKPKKREKNDDLDFDLDLDNLDEVDDIIVEEIDWNELNL